MKSFEDTILNGATELRLVITDTQISQFIKYTDELLKWNKKINLTSITSPDEVAVKHLIDSLAIAKYINKETPLLDIGSGGGFPSIPIKILYPGLEIVSVDTVGKKIRFQKHIARTLGFSGFTAIHARVEDLTSSYSEYFQSITSRAFSDIGQLIRVALPLLGRGGELIAMKGRSGRKEAEIATSKFELMNVEVTAIEEYRLPFLGDDRSIIILKRKAL